MRLITVVMLLASMGCASSVRTADAVTVTIDAPGGSLAVEAEVADEPGERFRGLRGREQLPAGTGMLFLFDEVAARTFTMQDTLIPLDLLVIRAGRVVEIIQMVPCADAEECTYPTVPADAALEVNAGVASEAGIAPGALVDAPGLR